MDTEADSDEYMSCGTPPTELCEENDVAVGNLLPDKSRAAYETRDETSYDRFLTWQKQHRTKSFSQRVLVAYFSGLSKKWKASTMWSEYSKVAKMLKIKKKVDITEYRELK